MRACAAAVLGAATLFAAGAHGVTLCNGASCTNSLQCDRDSACYATSSSATVGRCLVRTGVSPHAYRHLGEPCSHAGDCDACSACVKGVCARAGAAAATSSHSEIDATAYNKLKEKLADEENLLARVYQNERSERQKVARLMNERQEMIVRTRHQREVSDRVAYFEIGFAALAMLTLVLAVVVRHVRGRRHGFIGRSGTPPTAPLSAEAAAMLIGAESSDDEEVPEAAEQELMEMVRNRTTTTALDTAAGEGEGESEEEADGNAGGDGDAASRSSTPDDPPPPTAPAAPQMELNIDDPNTCKVCLDAVIDCVLLDCGHMCACLQCAKRCRNCPMCRRPIRKRKRIYKS